MWGALNSAGIKRSKAEVDFRLTADRLDLLVMADEMNSLLSLEEELSCSICLFVFDNPVTTPCGHNFCQDCLDKTWQDSDQVALGFNCPQCRTHFYTKPELKKNTVLNTVVKTLKLRLEESNDVDVEVKKVPEVAEITCDVCREIKAYKTCLTCMASYCEEHVRPHKENPIFSTHQMTDPLSDLKERICLTHNKMMEFYCSTHSQCICVVCLQEKHNNCSICKPEERRNIQESELKKMMYNLDGKIEKTHTVVSQMKEQQFVLKDSASSRKRILESEFQQIRELIDRSEQEAVKLVDQEQDSGNEKIQSLMKRFALNVEQMKETKSQIESLLGKKESFMFLQAKVNLPRAVDINPYAPRVSVNSRQVIASEDYVLALKKFFENLLKEPVEKRLQLLNAGGWGLGHDLSRQPQLPNADTRNTSVDDRNKEVRHPTMPDVRGTRRDMIRQPPGQQGARKKSPFPKPMEIKGEKVDKTKKKPPHLPREPVIPLMNIDEPPKALGLYIPHEPGNAAKRSDLLKYGVELTLDPMTAHKRILLLENFTKAMVSEEPSPYPDGPGRFAVCSQVLGTRGFSQGRQYWEVKMSSNNFCGLGLAYKSIDRKGPASRLGRNSQSWCVEWFNIKLSAWHNSREIVLENPNPSRVGILLDCDQGTVTFYTVADRAYPFYTFIQRFSQPVYPAFWIFSSGSHVTLCKMIN
ncbi:E3 ubiquitin/ISG15 ligase TRIM25 isoform X3 [Brienomyrus brachyistius]|uniref:E3 ubiquitin/ISG15 ligase TRIM25 isoform X1 n=1 Tax=Brienomyrus brachyistius TaxID=42636 RepID=UPI0020B31BB8|nr:E3 ubiquitin/ISG15 ligase TRIM25 isoform X1 [Brienomyrus brachyistius]XP_048870950.1 E3 ubiquitin/ISG15 ligase TRIM25 isoform X2 [Brienomyrus brachyistius]XP_048870951.1 E3 ubiquitin/ISG15 ligase TRIM25 isoform X3 [Brienomyrus brachyistius]